LLGGRRGAAQVDPAAHDRARAQPRRRRARAPPRGRAPAHAPPARPDGARHAPDDSGGPPPLPARPRSLQTTDRTDSKTMDFNKLTLKSQEAVAAAQELARRLGNPELYPEHLLLALDVVPRDQLEAKIKAVRGGQRVTSQDPEETYQALEKFGRDLTAAAEEGKLDPVIGRDEEIRRVIQVLSRRTKNNPVL